MIDRRPGRSPGEAAAVYLEYLRDLGVPGLRVSAPPAGVKPEVAPAAPSPAPGPGGRPAAGGGEDALRRLREEDIGDCRRCGLCEERTNIVFGVGAPAARLMFVGEGPGRDEDIQGIPFVGRAGQLLTDIIGAMKLRREDVYIANIVKCRPPGNRNPEPEEIAACIGFLRRQIEIISPEVLVGLGSIAVQSLLETTTGITRLRGEFREYKGIPFMATFHPAYLLRNPAKKREVWQDMQQVMARLGLQG